MRFYTETNDQQTCFESLLFYSVVPPICLINARRDKTQSGLIVARSGLLVACYASLHPALSVRPLVRPPVGPSIRPSHFTFFGFLGLWPHCSCPSNQVTSNTVPAHLHATGVAVYPALFSWQILFHSLTKLSFFVSACYLFDSIKLKSLTGFDSKSAWIKKL